MSDTQTVDPIGVMYRIHQAYAAASYKHPDRAVSLRGYLERIRGCNDMDTRLELMREAVDYLEQSS